MEKSVVSIVKGTDPDKMVEDKVTVNQDVLAGKIIDYFSEPFIQLDKIVPDFGCHFKPAIKDNEKSSK